MRGYEVMTLLEFLSSLRVTFSKLELFAMMCSSFNHAI